jgi:fatty acid desaturase
MTVEARHSRAAAGRQLSWAGAQRKRFDPLITARLRRLQKRDDWHNALYLAVDYGVIAGAVVAAELTGSLLLYAIALVVIASRMRALNNLVHEASHKLLFRTVRLNRWAGMLLCAFPIGTSMHAYRRSHGRHHRMLGDPVFDPDRVRYRELGVEDLPKPRGWVVRRFLRMLTLYEMPRYVVGTLRSFVHTSETPRSETVGRWVFWGALAAALTALGGWTLFLLYWVVPFFTTFQVLRYVSEISEHGGLYDNEDPLDLARNSVPHPFVRAVLYPHNDNLHLVHHLFPGIPHFRLARAHRILQADADYAGAHHCYGYFLRRRDGRPSTFAELTAAA